MMLLVVYGIDPTDFDLNDEDVPPVLDLRALRDLGNRQRTWNGDIRQFPAPAVYPLAA